MFVMFGVFFLIWSACLGAPMFNLRFRNEDTSDLWVGMSFVWIIGVVSLLVALIALK